MTKLGTHILLFTGNLLGKKTNKKKQSLQVREGKRQGGKGREGQGGKGQGRAGRAGQGRDGVDSESGFGCGEVGRGGAVQG